MKFLENRAYAASKSVVDLTKWASRKAQSKILQPPKDAWGWLRYHINKLLNMGRDGYLGIAAEWFFRSLGLSTLSIATMIVGFSLIVVAPIVLILMMLIFPHVQSDEAQKPRPVIRRRQAEDIGNVDIDVRRAEMSEARDPLSAASGLIKEKEQ